MAIVVEQFYIDDRLFNKTYSDAGRAVVRDGISYSEACDPAEYGRTYTEGDPLPEGEPDEVEIRDKAEAYDILMGVIE